MFILKDGFALKFNKTLAVFNCLSAHSLKPEMIENDTTKQHSI